MTDTHVYVRRAKGHKLVLCELTKTTTGQELKAKLFHLYEFDFGVAAPYSLPSGSDTLLLFRGRALSDCTPLVEQGVTNGAILVLVTTAAKYCCKRRMSVVAEYQCASLSELSQAEEAAIALLLAAPGVLLPSAVVSQIHAFLAKAQHALPGVPPERRAACEAAVVVLRFWANALSEACTVDMEAEARRAVAFLQSVLSTLSYNVCESDEEDDDELKQLVTVHGLLLQAFWHKRIGSTYEYADAIKRVEELTQKMELSAEVCSQQISATESPVLAKKAKRENSSGAGAFASARRLSIKSDGQLIDEGAFRLWQMGYPEDKARVVLKEAHGDFNEALELLCESRDGEEEEEEYYDNNSNSNKGPNSYFGMFPEPAALKRTKLPLIRNLINRLKSIS